MTAKVTLSFSDDTIADARRFARQEGVSLSAWIDRAAREKALRELFGAHAAVVRRAGFDEATALTDEREVAMIDAAMFRGAAQGQQATRGRGPAEGRGAA